MNALPAVKLVPRLDEFAALVADDPFREKWPRVKRLAVSRALCSIIKAEGAKGLRASLRRYLPGFITRMGRERVNLAVRLGNKSLQVKRWQVRLLAAAELLGVPTPPIIMPGGAMLAVHATHDRHPARIGSTLGRDAAGNFIIAPARDLAARFAEEAG